MSYDKHHSDMDAPQYVNVYVPSGPSVAWTSYYTHRSNMDAPQYVHVDVLSDAAVA